METAIMKFCYSVALQANVRLTEKDKVFTTYLGIDRSIHQKIVVGKGMLRKPKSGGFRWSNDETELMRPISKWNDEGKWSQTLRDPRLLSLVTLR